MTDAIISLRISKEMLEKMRAINEINWSAFLRNCLKSEIEKMNKTQDNFDIEKARKAAESMDKIRKSGVFDGGKTGTEIIREWRDKRR